MSLGPWFEAKRDGKCAKCAYPVKVGDQMRARSRGVFLCFACGMEAETAPVVTGENESGVLHDLGQFPDEVAQGALAKGMIHMARELDDGAVAPRDVASYIQQIRQSLQALQLQYPPAGEEDETDQMRLRRERNMMGGFGG